MTSAGDDEPAVDFGDAWAFGASSDTSEAARAAGALEKPRDLVRVVSLTDVDDGLQFTFTAAPLFDDIARALDRPDPPVFVCCDGTGVPAFSGSLERAADLVWVIMSFLSHAGAKGWMPAKTYGTCLFLACSGGFAQGRVFPLQAGGEYVDIRRLSMFQRELEELRQLNVHDAVQVMHTQGLLRVDAHDRGWVMAVAPQHRELAARTPWTAADMQLGVVSMGTRAHGREFRHGGQGLGV